MQSIYTPAYFNSFRAASKALAAAFVPDRFGTLYLPERHLVPLTEHDGLYAGPPADDSAALDELERQVTLGAEFFAFGWPAFWQGEHYAELSSRLENEGRKVLENDRVVVFALSRPQSFETNYVES